MKARTLLELGRVSNLPTVWSNVLAGAVLSGAAFSPALLLGPLAAGTAIYVGGMLLNDAFDREVDARERPRRPIPSGRASVREVVWTGAGLLACGWLLLWVHVIATGRGQGALAAGAALVGAVVLYDLWHKGNPLSPVLMGLCRALLYAVAGFALTATPGPAMTYGAAMLLCYLVGLTYVAKQETLTRLPNLWPLAFLALPAVYAAPAMGRGAGGAALYFLFLGWISFALWKLARREAIGTAVVALIAGISLLDAVLIARAGEPALAWVAAAALPLTLALQRFVRGT